VSADEMSDSPLLGGTLSRPHERFGGPFNTEFWKDFPYLLPCLVAASFSTVMLLLGVVFLVEVRRLKPTTLSVSLNLIPLLLLDKTGPQNQSHPRQRVF